MPIFKNPKAKFEIYADDKTKKGVDSAESNLERLKKQVTLTGLASVAAAGIGGLGLLTTAGIRMGDELAKTSDKLGLSTEALAGLRNAARLTGVQTNQLDLGIQRMTRRIAEAAQGTGEAKDALKELGIDAVQLAQKSPDEQFKQIAAAMSQVSSQSDRVRLGFKLFDSEGVALINTLRLGTDGLEAAAEEAARFGTALSRVQAREVELAADAMGRVKTAGEGLATQLGARLAPSLTTAGNALADFIAYTTNTAIPALSFLAEKIGLVDRNARSLSFAELQVQAELLKEEIEEAEKKVAKFGATQKFGGTGQVPEFVVDHLAALNTLERRLAEVQLRMQELSEPFKVDGPEISEITLLPVDRSGLDALNADSKRRQRLAEEREKREQESAARAEQREREQRERELEAVRNFFKTREELELEAFERREEIIRENMEAGAERDALLLENERAKAQYLIDLEKYKQEEINRAVLEGIHTREQFEKASLKTQVKGVLGTLENITAGIATHSRKAFEANKAAAIANAIINTAEGVTKALSAYPPPLSFAMATAQAAAGLAQVSAIRSASFGGGSTPSVVGSTPTLNGQPVPSQAPPAAARGSGQIIEVHIHGGVAAKDTVKDLFADIFDNDEVIIHPNSRQAAAIRGGR